MFNDVSNDKEKFDNLEPAVRDEQPDGVTINIFDFDNTTFKSPTPNEKIWGKAYAAKIRSEVDHHGYGWFQNPLTLDERFIDMDNFIEDVVDLIKKSKADPYCITVLLTGRNTSFTNNVKKIIDRKGLTFDKMGLKPMGTSLTTLQFKEGFIKDLIKEVQSAGNKINALNMWDDRANHVERLRRFISTLGLPSAVVNHVTGGEAFMQEDKEKEVVSLLKEQTEKTHPENEEPQPVYYAAVLDDQSRNRLLEAIPVPDGWKRIAHHMTIIPPNRIKETGEIKDFVLDNLRNEVSMAAVEYGVSEDAIAVKVVGKVPSFNNIPHITVAIPVDGKASNSNKITNWKPLDNHIYLSGRVRGIYDRQNSSKNKETGNKKTSIGDFIKNKFPNELKNNYFLIGPIITAIKTNNWDIEKDKDQIANYIKRLNK